MQVTFIMKLFDIYSTIGLKTFRNSQTPLEFVKILSIFIKNMPILRLEEAHEGIRIELFELLLFKIIKINQYLLRYKYNTLLTIKDSLTFA